jgi:hypothetical protein
MSNLRIVSIAAFAACVLAAPTMADDNEEAKTTPKIFQDVVDCRKIEADYERLACYDRNVTALELAQQTKQVFVADKEQVEKSRRGLFGFSLPKIKIFGDGGSDGTDIGSITAKITSARENAGKYIFTLDDGAIWAQTEQGYIGLTPKPGQEILIKRAAMGSYLGKVSNGRAFRIKRVNE